MADNIPPFFNRVTTVASSGAAESRVALKGADACVPLTQAGAGYVVRMGQGRKSYFNQLTADQQKAVSSTVSILVTAALESSESWATQSSSQVMELLNERVAQDLITQSAPYDRRSADDMAAYHSLPEEQKILAAAQAEAEQLYDVIIGIPESKDRASFVRGLEETIAEQIKRADTRGFAIRLRKDSGGQSL
jgi:hypothetical protein